MLTLHVLTLITHVVSESLHTQLLICGQLSSNETSFSDALHFIGLQLAIEPCEETFISAISDNSLHHYEILRFHTSDQ